MLTPAHPACGFVLRTLDEPGRSLTAAEYRAARSARGPLAGQVADPDAA